MSASSPAEQPEQPRGEPEFVLTDHEDDWDTCWVPVYAAATSDEAEAVAAVSAPIQDDTLRYVCDGDKGWYRPRSAVDFEWQECKSDDGGALELWRVQVGDVEGSTHGRVEATP